MYIAGWVKRSLARRGITLKRFEFPNDRPFQMLRMVVESVLSPDFQVVQIGANDGFSDDPAAEIIRTHDLKALLVEPIVPMYRKLVEYYAGFPNVTCENCAIARQDGTMTLYTVRPDPSLPRYVTRLASFDRNIVLRQRGTVPTIARFIEPVQVPAITLQTLLGKHDIDRLDWLQLDTEGFDFEIIKMLFETPFRPRVISFESVLLSREDKLACAKALRREGYRYVTVDRDTIAIAETTTPVIGAEAFAAV
jgi:FkbM family methyltransferase